jgi:competence protein ComFC
MLLSKIIETIYPTVCGICEKKTKSNTYTCEKCRSILKYYKERRIIKVYNKYYDSLLSLYEYKGIIKRQIIKLKFHEAKYIRLAFATMLAEKIKKIYSKYDVIIPVPISYKRYLERGFNQSELIARKHFKNTKHQNLL